MASTASTVLRLELMNPGENDGTWGTKNNSNYGILESALTGTTSISTTGGTTTLTNVDYVDDQAKKLVLNVSGALVSSATIVIPNAAKSYKVLNRTTGAFTLSVKTSSGTAIVVTQSTGAEVYCDGANVVRFLTPMVDFTTGAPATSSGAAASSVSVSATGNLSSTNAQAALAELQGDIDTINAALPGYQPLDTDLTTIGGLAKTKGNVIVADGSGWAAQSVGTDGFALIAKAGATNGVQWSALLPAGTVSLFYQAAAPTGWTVSDADTDKALRIVSGVSGLGGAAGGSTAFTSVFAARTITTAMLPSHTHDAGTLATSSSGSHVHTLAFRLGNSNIEHNSTSYVAGGSTATISSGSAAVTAGGDHTHTMSGATAAAGSGSTIDFAVQYCSVIKAAKAAY